MKRAYTIWVCPECSDHYQFAGFCDSCSRRLNLIRVIPIEQINAFAGESQQNSSVVPRYWITEFVRGLLDWSSSSG